MNPHSDKTLKRILEYFLEKGLLKVTRIEGMAQYFGELAKMIDEDCLEARLQSKENLKHWVKYWSTNQHSGHGPIQLHECTNLACESAMNTIKELS